MVDLLRKSQEEILRIIHSKGWNLYDSTGVKSKDEAILARNSRAKELFGEFAL